MQPQQYIQRSGKGGSPCGCQSQCAGAFACFRRLLSSSCFLSLPANTFGCTSHENLTQDRPSSTYCVMQKHRKIPKFCLRKQTDSPGFSIGRKRNLSTSTRRNSSRRGATSETKYTPTWAGFVLSQKPCHSSTYRKCWGSS